MMMLERAVDRLPVAVHADIALEVDEVESFGRPEYFSIERPSRTGWRPISRAYSTRVFTRAMWEENVVATIPPE